MREPTKQELIKYKPLDASTIRNRPNKTARGASKTAERGRHKIVEGPALFLQVRGTTDRLRGVQSYRTKKPCICCGSKDGGKWMLNNEGRRKLERMRRLHNETL